MLDIDRLKTLLGAAEKELRRTVKNHSGPFHIARKWLADDDWNPIIADYVVAAVNSAEEAIQEIERLRELFREARYELWCHTCENPDDSREFDAETERLISASDPPGRK